ncbi:MAG: hypothetical protein IH948_10140, partial [Bacteroidetes bacterium]|nr:hypothetical protein [Bacteroidota bacterium]
MMNRRNQFSLTVLFIAGVLGTGCSKNIVTMTVTEPAPVTIYPEIKKIGIVDRTEVAEKTSMLDKIDKVLSLEVKNLDKEAAVRTISGVQEELELNGRFDVVSRLDSVDVRTPGMGVFPAKIPWEQVEQICSEFGVDALFVLEFFDTHGKVNYQVTSSTTDAPFGLKIPLAQHTASLRTTVNTGWRIYDPINKLILDEIVLSDQFVLTGTGINPVAAVAAILGRKETVMDIGHKLGVDYAMRLLPIRIRVSRPYYVKGTDNFKIAKRKAQIRDWDGAAVHWEIETSNRKRKIAGRAFYN